MGCITGDDEQTGARRDHVADPATAGIPFVAETPGAENGQAKDVATLKMLRQSTRAPGRPLGETVGSA
jgi:hypothetical protein